MPAPDFFTLYDFETQIETAWKTVLVTALAAVPITCQVLVTRDSATDNTPRIELSMALRGIISQRRIEGNKLVPNAFNAVMTARVVTTRPVDNTGTPLHGTIRGLVRNTMAANTDVINNTLLPWLQILEYLPGAGSPQIIDEKEQDVTELTYDFQFAIANEAWPA
jgi:hypothetical protein